MTRERGAVDEKCKQDFLVCEFNLFIQQADNKQQHCRRCGFAILYLDNKVAHLLY